MRLDPTPYLGRPYVQGEYDCADLVVDVAREQLGVRLTLPGRAASQRGRDLQIAALTAALAEPVDTPAEGDLVLMRVTGRRHEVGRHAGVWHHPPGHAPHVLHCAGGAGTCLHPVAGLEARGYQITGVYRWLPVAAAAPRISIARPR